MKTQHYLFFSFLLLAFHACTGDQVNNDNPADTSMDMNSMPGMEGMEGMHHDANNSARIDHSEMLALTAREQLLAGIKTDTVRKKPFSNTISALGVVAIDEGTVTVLSARLSGRINRLFVRNAGADVAAGEPLYEIYSETFFAEQQELLNLIAGNSPADLIEAAREKLILNGMSRKQVADVEKSKSVSSLVTICSPVSGYLTQLEIREGAYVVAGDILFEIATLDEVRINAQVYPDEISAFRSANVFSVESGAAPGITFHATKLYDNPSLEPNSKILNVRLRVRNPDHVLLPGMMTTVKAGADTEQLITIPSTSVLMEDGMTFTWIREPDGMFSRRMIHTGKNNGAEVEITDGLQAGECVVVSGIYLLNSEYILRKGNNSMGGMKM